MKEALQTAFKKMTLEIIYEAVDVRTKDIKQDLTRLDDRLDKLEDNVSDLRSDMNRQFAATNARIDGLISDMNHRFDAANGEINHRFDALNGRIDQLFNLIISQNKS